MNALKLTLGITLMCNIFVTGCTTPVPVVSQTMRCDASPDLLASECGKPKQIPEDATYETLLGVMRDDRQALLECGIKMEALRDSIVRCNQQTDQFNKKVEVINNRK